MKKIIALLLLSVSSCVVADDWGAAFGAIEKMYVYTDFVVVVQGGIYAGEAECESSNKWSFYWNSLDEKVADRAYSTLLAAYLAKTPIKPIFSSSGCGPENLKKFNGNIVIGG